MGYMPNELLKRLVGARLYSVQFVMDYVQLRFDRERSDEMPVLNCYVFPAVVRGGRAQLPGELGWADALVGLIPQIVTSTNEGTGTGIELWLGDDAVRLGPPREQADTPEMAVLSGFDDGQWMVWRVGEDSFEDPA
ncbi:hypothetical protein AB0I28_36685 [Phytomonospora sp. NPDC050363]|uniref:hypothetical protein n=1 Tax=Phytomonospora sp. NPDC050363 TaxID=3155642 RepID=UPI0033F022A2